MNPDPGASAGPGRAKAQAWLSASTLRQLRDHELAKATVVNQDEYDVQAYWLTLLPDFTAHSITGTVTVDFESLVAGLDHIDLDLYDTMTVVSVSDGSTITTFTHENDILSVQLTQPVDAGAVATVTIHYQGIPQPAGFLGMQFSQHAGVPILATLSEPYFARSWWPCKDVPTDKATVQVVCEVPASMYCASNGELIGAYETENDTRLFVWKEGYPIATYLVSIAVTEYVGWEEPYTSASGNQMTLEYKVFAEDYDAARVDFERTAEMLDLFSSYFGEYPFIKDKYGMAEFVWEGAMEHQTMSSYGDFLLTGDKFYERLVAHELSHHWWGDLMTLEDWNETWLHEGFATYCEALWIEHVSGPAAYRARMQAISFKSAGFGGPIIPPLGLFNHTVYKKGAWVLHMLRHVLGDPVFFSAMRDYAHLRSSQYANVSTDEFIDSMENSTDRDLSWFFDEWLYREGRPTYAIVWTSQPWGLRHHLTVTIEQVQAEDPWTMPLDLRVETSGGSEDFVVWVDSRLHSFSFWLDEVPTQVTLDPDGWVLARVVVGSPTGSEPVSGPAATLLPSSPNPFNPSTLLRFRLADEQAVRLKVFDVQGRLVRILEPGRLSSGLHEVPFDGRDVRGVPLGSGVYRVLLEAGGARQSQSVTLLK